MEFYPEEAANETVKPMSQYAARKLGVSERELDAFITEYMSSQVLYRSAIREVSNRLEILDDEFQYRHKRNPIHNIQTRLKTPQSTMEKMGRRNLLPKMEVMRQELTDIAGVRVICSYVDDIYRLADLLSQQEGVEILQQHDYIKKPKGNGYRSLHMVITVPVRLSDGAHRVPVEIQIRTIAMDFWASLEHELRYKSGNNITDDMAEELLNCARSISKLDDKMQHLYNQMEDVPPPTHDKPNGEAT